MMTQVFFFMGGARPQLFGIFNHIQEKKFTILKKTCIFANRKTKDKMEARIRKKASRSGDVRPAGRKLIKLTKYKELVDDPFSLKA